MIRFYREGILKNIVPLILCVSIVASCMYVYSREYLAAVTLITVIIQATVFSFYTYISGKSMLLRFVSILGSFFAIGGLVSIAVKTGNNQSTVDYFVWFLSPQSLVDFSPSYIAATFIIINFFIASTVYYFSAVRYRISMTFLITLIPFAFYRKETEQVPVFFALLLLVMYMALMIHCRQINTKPRHKMIVEKGYKRSMVVFLAFTALLALVVPKPKLDIDNSWVDTVFESQRFTDYMLHRLGIVSETASSSLAYTGNANVKLFEFITNEDPVNLKSQTYSLYNFEKNLWRTMENETSGEKLSETDAELLDPSEFYKAVAAAAELDSKWAGKYGLENLAPELKEPYIRSVSLLSTRVNSRFCYSPVLAYAVSVVGSGRGDVFRTEQGMLYSAASDNPNYTLRYYSDSSLSEKNLQTVVNSVDNNTFPVFLSELIEILSDNGITDYNEVITAYVDDYFHAMEYYQKTETEMPESVYRITEKVVSGCDSDLEKAQAIESYFRLNDFKYSLAYKKPDGYNMEYFLTEGKTGLCSDYATAMVLMARAAGIPARYAEGLHLHDPYDEAPSSVVSSSGRKLPGLYVSVTDSDLHAFPELYISGFGWKSFEPTQLSVAEEKSSFDYRMSVVMAVTALALIIFILFFDRKIRPYFSEKIFFSRLKRASNEKSVSMIVSRIRNKLGLDSSMTSAETGRYVLELFGTDMTATVNDYDAAVYGGQKLNEEARKAAEELYSRLTEMIREKKKAEKRRMGK
ncbi:transglutaminase-like domain-containing protein [Ruminococcus sp. HUN007]|uniref:transglutaminase-like domain-containing protein n=1 Tax=Ruminococcus sp. HUN007 TaxID=1514668 RepID=UPI0005D260BF|nr:transglutaminase-like domain-containing protein [Ruminococcus sp. HUN007]